MLKINMRESDNLALNVGMLQLHQKIWRSMLNVNMKEWDIPVNTCEYAATTTGDLKIHVENKHEGVRYPCPECEYVATTSKNLKINVESKHVGVRYSCKHCEHANTSSGNL